MKKYGKLAITLVAGWCMLQAGQALATSVTLPLAYDTAITFPTYAGIGPYATTDSVGDNPDVQTISITIDDQTHRLQSITFNMTSPVGSTPFDPNTMLASLYINTTGWGENWNYFVSSGAAPGSTGVGDGWTVGHIAVNGLYKVNNFDPTTDYNTVTAGSVNGSLGRAGNANGISATADLLQIAGLNTSNPDTSVQLAKVDNGDGTYSLTYSFGASLSINLGDQFTIGWTPYCANDVVYLRGSLPGTAPEPVTMMLFGAGLAGLAGWRRRLSPTR